MAELTTLETKLAEVTGLAMAARGAGEKVSRLVEDDDLKEALAEIRDDAAETEERCTKLAESLDGKKTTILEKARETRPPGKDRCSSPPRKIRTRSRASSSPSGGWADRLRARRSP